MRILAIFAATMIPNIASATAFPSISCVFTEPFIGIEVWNSGTRVITPEGLFPVSQRILGGTRLEPTITAKVNGMDLKLSVINDVGSDGMSEFARPLTGELMGWPPMPTALTGACLRYPDGTTPRPVIGISNNGKLNVRARANASSRLLGQLRPRSRFWAFPESAQNGWVRGAFERIPSGESGMITVGEGWVRARYLGLAGGE